MGLAVAHDGGQGDLVEVLADAVLFQGGEHLEEAPRVADHRHMETQILLEALEHLGGVLPKGPIIEGGLPHVGDLLADLGQFHLVHGNVPEAPVAPDLLGLELHERALGLLLVGLDAGAHLGPQELSFIGDLQMVLLQDVVQGIRGGPIVLLVGIQVLQRAAHIEHNSLDHARSSRSVFCFRKRLRTLD